jgi:NAD(P)-dependent dehydrogenase (short-subunit alcohol dehydrogenase family)
LNPFDNIFSLSGKTALVAGASRGIGLAIAQALAAQGAQTILAARSMDKLEASAKELPNSRALQIDLANSNSIRDAAESAGAVDILVNVAGTNLRKRFEQFTREEYERILQTNLHGIFELTQLIGAKMIARGQGGKIINMASQAGRRGEALVSIYCASKAAVISLTQSTGLDLIKHRINVNGIAPGVVDTPMWNEVDALFAKYEHRPLGEKKRLVGEAVPFGRMGLPEDHAGAAVFLASADSDYVVAQTLNVDGGNWMS